MIDSSTVKQFPITLSDDFTGSVYNLDGALNRIHEEESYLLSSSGLVLRIMRGPNFGDDYQAVFELYSLDGHMKSRYQKRYEPPAIFSLQMPPDIANSDFYQLRQRPSFIPQPNTSFRSETISNKSVRRPKSLGAAFYD